MIAKSIHPFTPDRLSELIARCAGIEACSCTESEELRQAIDVLVDWLHTALDDVAALLEYQESRPVEVQTGGRGVRIGALGDFTASELDDIIQRLLEARGLCAMAACEAEPHPDTERCRP